MIINEIRLANLHTLIKEAGSMAELGRKTGVDPAYLSQIKNGVKNPSGWPRNVGGPLARVLEKGMKKNNGWMAVKFACWYGTASFTTRASLAKRRHWSRTAPK